jgi:hypothetical protein
VNVGNGGFSEGIAQYLSLVFSFSGQPYVAFEDVANGWGVTVMKYDSIYVQISELQNSHFNIYPNPTSTTTTIEIFNDGNTIKSIELTDIMGVNLLEIKTIENKINLDIENYPSGIYFVTLRMNSSVYVEKVCKK